MALNADGTTDFWTGLTSKIRGIRRGGSIPETDLRRDQSHVAVLVRVEQPKPAERAAHVAPDALDRAVSGQHKRRSQLAADQLAAPFIAGQRPGEHAYRVLKAGFDALCYDAGIDAISDKRFASLLAAAGGRRYRTGFPKVTMYSLPRRRQVRLAA